MEKKNYYQVSYRGIVMLKAEQFHTEWEAIEKFYNLCLQVGYNKVVRSQIKAKKINPLS